MCSFTFSYTGSPTNHNTWSHVWCAAGHACVSSSVCSLLGRVESDCLRYWLIYKRHVPSVHVPLLLCTSQRSCPCWTSQWFCPCGTFQRSSLCWMLPWWLHKSMTTFLRHHNISQTTGLRWQPMSNVMSCTVEQAMVSTPVLSSQDVWWVTTGATTQTERNWMTRVHMSHGHFGLCEVYSAAVVIHHCLLPTAD